MKKLAVDVGCDVGGSILFAAGIYTFARSADFAPGGISGLALIINYLTNFPIGSMTLLLNVPIILLSFKVLGKAFLLRSLRTMVISTLFLDVVFPLLPVYTGNQFLAALYAGVLTGGGLAVIYMRGSSTGGADFWIVSIKRRFPHLSMGKITLFSDGCIILLGGLVFRNVDAVLYGMVCTYASSVVIDKVLYGAGSGKMAVIVTSDGIATAEKISRTVERGSTLVKAIGPYSSKERHMIFCTCAKSEIFKVTQAAHHIDSEAFVTVTEASEVFGEGFSQLGEPPR